MLRLIDADELLIHARTFEDKLWGADGLVYKSEQAVTTYSICKAATVDPVKHGRWMEDHSDVAKFTWCRCSECGNKLVNYTVDDVKAMYPYCNMCGAKMDKEHI